MDADSTEKEKADPIKRVIRASLQPDTSCGPWDLSKRARLILYPARNGRCRCLPFHWQTQIACCVSEPFAPASNAGGYGVQGPPESLFIQCAQFSDEHACICTIARRLPDFAVHWDTPPGYFTSAIARA